jgi:hypothetical protein
MKKWMFLFSAAALSSTIAMAQVPTYEEVSPDLGVSVQLAMPGAGDFDLYEYGLGAELQFRDFVSAPWGYLLAIGYSEWTTDSDAKNPGSNLYDFDGNLAIIPFGGSVLYKVYNEESLSVVLDVGVRYLSTESDITARNSDSPPDKRFELDYDDAMIYRLGVSADYVLSPDFIWSTGIGYQGDLMKADITTELGPARDNVMESFVFETGIRLPF